MKALRLFACLSVSALSIAAATPALALANRVFVSARSGNNANACDNINTPCQTLQGAINQLNPDGEAIVLDSGGYGPVTITQGVTIEVPAGVTAFIHPPAGDAITVNAGSGRVALRGLTLNVGTGNGITVTTVGTLTVENCAITGFSGDGIHTTSGAQLDIIRSSFQANGTGLNALGATGDLRATIRESTFLGNGTGINAEANSGHTAAVDISHSTFSHNSVGIRPSNNFGTTPVRLAFSTVTGNSTGVQPVNLGTFFTQGNNMIRENPLGNIAPLTGGTSTVVGGD